jgi:hypothetical protein
MERWIKGVAVRNPGVIPAGHIPRPPPISGLLRSLELGDATSNATLSAGKNTTFRVG